MHERRDEGGARRLVVDARLPAPTIMAGGVGSVNRGQYRVEVGARALDGSEETDMASVRVSKPPYRVPSMADVARARGTNGLKMMSTFSGCGGSCLGFELAGFTVLWANEFVPAAREVYQLNHPGVPVSAEDVRAVDPLRVLRQLGLKPGQLDVLEGSPPCASFSTAGKRAKGWGQVKKYSDVEQRTDDLFFEFARFVRVVQPRAFVAENVSGLVKGVAKGYFKQILRELQACGYRVEARLLDAQWLGVPQQRQRVIFVGLRADLGADPGACFPAPLPYRYSVADACPWIVTHLNVHNHGTHDLTGRPSCTIRTTDSGQHKVLTARDPDPPTLDGTAIGREALTLREGEQSGVYFQLQRADRGKPSPTICACHGGKGVASVIHPTEMRKFSILELKRICSFPDDFRLAGTYARQWERLGRAVPPLMMRAVAVRVRDALLRVPAAPKRRLTLRVRKDA